MRWPYEVAICHARLPHEARMRAAPTLAAAAKSMAPSRRGKHAARQSARVAAATHVQRN